jgi:hypothetical protein
MLRVCAFHLYSWACETRIGRPASGGSEDWNDTGRLSGGGAGRECPASAAARDRAVHAEDRKGDRRAQSDPRRSQ